MFSSTTGRRETGALFVACAKFPLIRRNADRMLDRVPRLLFGKSRTGEIAC
jgi:hypothetical protein